MSEKTFDFGEFGPIGLGICARASYFVYVYSQRHSSLASTELIHLPTIACCNMDSKSTGPITPQCKMASESAFIALLGIRLQRLAQKRIAQHV